MSDIRVSVQWENSTVFAGEEVKCKITFKNVSHASNFRRSPSPGSQSRTPGSGRERWIESLHSQPQQSPTSHSYKSSVPHLKSPQLNGSLHRSTFSLNPHSIGLKNSSDTSPPEGASENSHPTERRHKRSVSIVSIKNEAPAIRDSFGEGYLGSKRPNRSHARAASLQVLPHRTGMSSAPLSAPVNDRATTMPSPLLKASTSFAEQSSNLHAGTLLKSQSAGFAIAAGSRTQRKAPDTISTNFRFPQGPPPIAEARQQPASAPTRFLSPQHTETINGVDHMNPITRVLSSTSVNGTPRSSGEFYTMSNNSTETLASEYPTQDQGRLSQKFSHGRQLSLLGPLKSSRATEILMMGYGYIMGSFTLDGSLVNQAPFEEVKRKGVVGDQGGGGVVRAESMKRESGLFRGIGWGNIGESLGGLLGSAELSSIKETKYNTHARSIPILSTPQSVLFVNLQLEPGQSKSYTYNHILPRGIPPTHKGRAMKVSYNLRIGTQRAANSVTKHQVQTVDVPFRVLTGVNGRGDILSHDLMSPHIILQDATSISMTNEHRKHQKHHIIGANLAPLNKSDACIRDFLSYVEATLDNTRQNSGLSLLSPTECGQSLFTPVAEAPGTVKDAIDLALLRSNSTTASKRSANRFEITRSGDRVAVISLARPAYRLGEAISSIIEFQESDISCYSLHATLESSESVDPSIALRSKASIQRATRRIHVSHSESTLFQQRASFSPVIPTSATPGFKTSGISLEWSLRFEFVTARNKRDDEIEEEDLLEEVARDGRGSVVAAVQALPCDTFDVTVPLKIYGATSTFDEKNETGDFSI